MEIKQLKVIAFDADDTIWVNEPIFREAEKDFATRFKNHAAEDGILQVLLDTEIKNLKIYGYGIKGFVLSLLEAAQYITNGKLKDSDVKFILDLGKRMLAEPVKLLPGIEKVFDALAKNYKLVVATKGDLLDQERKLIKSGLVDYFHHIEIVSDKTEKQYKKLVKHLDINPDEFVMVGNSIKSDVLPVLAMGGNAVHIPFHTTWAHEEVTEKVEHPRFISLKAAPELLELLVAKQ